MLEALAAIPEMSDIVVTVFAARRRRLIESGQAGLTLIGAETDRAVRRIEAFAAQNRIPYRAYALGSPEAAALAARCGVAPARRRSCSASATSCPTRPRASSPAASASTSRWRRAPPSTW
jgi:hypothetical protein